MRGCERLEISVKLHDCARAGVMPHMRLTLCPDRRPRIHSQCLRSTNTTAGSALLLLPCSPSVLFRYEVTRHYMYKNKIFSLRDVSLINAGLSIHRELEGWECVGPAVNRGLISDTIKCSAIALPEWTSGPLAKHLRLTSVRA